MEQYAAPLRELIEEFNKLPGIGNKTAQRPHDIRSRQR